jgi:hypothetical protein
MFKCRLRVQGAQYPRREQITDMYLGHFPTVSAMFVQDKFNRRNFCYNKSIQEISISLLARRRIIDKIFHKGFALQIVPVINFML